MEACKEASGESNYKPDGLASAVLANVMKRKAHTLSECESIWKGVMTVKIGIAIQNSLVSLGAEVHEAYVAP